MKRTNYLTILLSSLVVLFLIVVNPVLSSDEEIQELKAQIEALQKRVDELEAENEDMPPDYGPKSGYRDRFFEDDFDYFDYMREMHERMRGMFDYPFENRIDSRMDKFMDNILEEREINFEETRDGYEVRFDIGDLNKDKVDIEINQNSITIKGEYSKESREDSPGRFYTSKSQGLFMKTIPLPLDADTAKVKTEQEGNTLIIRIPKV